MARTRAAYLSLAAVGGVGLILSMILTATFITTYGTLLTFYLLVSLPLLAGGLFAFLKAPEHPTARRLLLAGSLLAVSNFFEVMLGRLYVSYGVFSAMWAVNLAFQLTSVLSLIFTARLFGLFPDGRTRSTRERVVLGMLWAYLLLPVLLLVARPTLALPTEVFNALRGSTRVPNVTSPLHVGWLSALKGVALALVNLQQILVLVIGVGLMGLRFRRATYEQRIQIKWVLYAVSLMAMLQVAAQLVHGSGLLTGRAADELQNVALAPVALALMASMLIALFRYRLLDIDLVIRRSLVYGALWLLIGAAYVIVATGLGIAAGHRLPIGLAILVTVAATLLFQPLHRRLERVAGRMVYGERPSRYQLLTRFGETLEHAFDVGQLAPQVATAVRTGLDLKWARVSLALREGGAFEPAGSAGIALDDPAPPEVTVPLVHAGDRLGAIECGPRTEGRLKPEDHEVLATIARQASLGIHNSRLASELSARLDEIRRQAEELAASRARIVQTQDAERKRIERNIHDGVQQEMVALVAKMRLARNQLRRDPDVADATLVELQHEARQTLEELRELSRGIHPAVLTDHGLLEAVEERTSRLPIGVAIDAPHVLRGLRFSEETEGAAYFFVSEALANALKHASARRATVHMHIEGGRLHVEVTDDGVGFVPADATGSGLTGLRDRIEAVGGTLRVISRPGEGTTLVAVLPSAVEEAERVR